MNISDIWIFIFARSNATSDAKNRLPVDKITYYIRWIVWYAISSVNELLLVAITYTRKINTLLHAWIKATVV